MATESLPVYKFYKEDTGRWYIDLPDYGGPRADLQMVEGADTMLDFVGKGIANVELSLSETPFDGADKLKLIEDLTGKIGGGMYLLENYSGERLDKEMWLCEVTEVVFGKLPPLIYFKKI